MMHPRNCHSRNKGNQTLIRCDVHRVVITDFTGNPITVCQRARSSKVREKKIFKVLEGFCGKRVLPVDLEKIPYSHNEG